MGERTPHLDSNARGALVGLTASHTRAHIVRAILEGVAFSLRDTFTLFQEMNVPVQCIRLGGGGARSPLWRQDRKSTRLNSSHSQISYAVFCLKKKKQPLLHKHLPSALT